MNFARLAPVLVVLTTIAISAAPLIRGGEGNAPIADPGWPKGAASIFNDKGRIAYWEGPPFGGGEWHSECRGNAAALGQVVEAFAKLDAPNKKVVVHDGRGYSFWLAPNGEPEKRAKARIDWVFVVWQSGGWERLRGLPPDLNPTSPDDASPPLRLDVYAGELKWDDVKRPEGLTIVDERREAHGFDSVDGLVIEGKAIDAVAKRPIAATVRLEKIEARKTGGYAYTPLSRADAGADGRWFFKNVPGDRLRIVVEADGYAPKVVGYLQSKGEPGWRSFPCELARAGRIEGRVLDPKGNPMEGAELSLGDLVGGGKTRYALPDDVRVKSDAQGRFTLDGVPVGKAKLWATKAGWNGPSLGQPVEAPSQGVEVRLTRAASVNVTVDFAGKAPPAGYIVRMTPAGGDVVGSYGGSAQIDPTNKHTFADVPPGRYTFVGRPNPGADREETQPVEVDLKAGETAEVVLKAK